METNPVKADSHGVATSGDAARRERAPPIQSLSNLPHINISLRIQLHFNVILLARPL
jgi:hypothetical protein